MNNITVIDIETTGLDPFIHEIIEIGAVNETGTFSSKVRPLKLNLIDPSAVAVNGYNAEEWKDAPLLPDVLNDMVKFVSGTRFAAYNVTFDWSFFQKAYHDYGMSSPFHYQKLDILSLAVFGKLDLASNKLKHVCEALDIPPEPAEHRAINGAVCAYEVLKKLTSHL